MIDYYIYYMIANIYLSIYLSIYMYTYTDHKRDKIHIYNYN